MKSVNPYIFNTFSLFEIKSSRESKPKPIFYNPDIKKKRRFYSPLVKRG